MISGSLCGMFQSEEEHKRERKLCATGSLPACVIFICLFYSLCIWLCLIWRPPSPIILAAAQQRSTQSIRAFGTGAAPRAFGPHCGASPRGAGSGRTALPSSYPHPTPPHPPYTCTHIPEQLQPRQRNATQILHAATFQIVRV